MGIRTGITVNLNQPTVNLPLLCCKQFHFTRLVPLYCLYCPWYQCPPSCEQEGHDALLSLLGLSLLLGSHDPVIGLCASGAGIISPNFWCCSSMLALSPPCLASHLSALTPACCLAGIARGSALATGPGSGLWGSKSPSCSKQMAMRHANRSQSMPMQS